MLWGELALFALAMGLAQMSAGPDMLLLTQTSLAHGRSAGRWMATGIACGLVLHATFVLAGGTALLMGEAWLWRFANLAAALYLYWLAWRLFRAVRGSGAKAWEEASVGGEMSAAVAWRRGFFCNVLNPKAAVAIGGMTLPILSLSDEWSWRVWIFAVLVVQAWLLWLIWATILQAKKARALYQALSRWIDGAFAICLVVLGTLLLVG